MGQALPTPIVHEVMRSDIDPDARAYLEAMAAAGLPPVERLSPQEARANYERAAPMVAGEPVSIARVEDAGIAGIPVRIYADSTRAGLPVIAWFHGGGWVVGSLDSHDAACRRVARASGALVVSVGYRLAPEHPYPAAVEDAWAVVEWLGAHAAEVGGDPSRVAVGGDSAGGNLAAVVALRARDRRLQLAWQALLYPVTDADLGRTSYIRNATGYGLTTSAMRYYWDHYVPDPRRREEPEASPLRAASFAGVAPALVVVCELDPLRDEGFALAERMRADGVPTEYVEYPGMIHGFYRLHGPIAEAQELTGRLGDFARLRFGTPAEA